MKKWKEKAREIKEDIPALFLALKDSRTPWYAKAVAALTVGYALSPLDLIPDFIPVLGYLDDVLLLPVLCYLSIKLIPKGIIAENREKAKTLWKEGKTKRWYYAIPIVIFYLLLLFLLWAKVLKPIFNA